MLDCQKKIIITIGLDKVDEAIAAKKREKAFLVSILDPGRNYRDFDLIFVPSHNPYPKLPSIQTTTGLINHITPELLSNTHIPHLMRDLVLVKPDPASSAGCGVVAVLIGGRHVGGNFTIGDALRLGKIINTLKYSAIITTSRRTEKDATDMLKDAIRVPHIFFDYNNDGLAANPYPALLGLADKIIVTADSVRMCSEAASSGRQVFIFTPEETHFSYLSLRDNFIRAGAALPIEQINSSKPTILLNEAKRVADIIAKTVLL